MGGDGGRRRNPIIGTQSAKGPRVATCGDWGREKPDVCGRVAQTYNECIDCLDSMRQALVSDVLKRLMTHD